LVEIQGAYFKKEKKNWKLHFLRLSANKGLIWQVVHKSCNYNITFQKLDILAVKMIPISTCYTSGWGTINISWAGPLHYKWTGGCFFDSRCSTCGPWTYGGLFHCFV